MTTAIASDRATPPVSVVMAVHNGAAHLDEAVSSLRQQTFTDFELIIVNDGSTDATATILQQHAAEDMRLRVLTGPHQGLIASLNRGCGAARGRYLARMDADDVALPERLARQVAFLDQHPEVGLVGACVEFLDGDRRSGQFWRVPGSDGEIRAFLARYNAIIHPTVMMRRDCFLASGGYRAAFVAAEDYDLWLRLSERTKLANLPEILLLYRRHPAQVSMARIVQQTLSHLAAALAGERRRAGQPDPFADDRPISLPRLLEAGLEPQRIRDALLDAPVSQLKQLLRHGHGAAARQLLDELERLLETLPVTRAQRGDLAWLRSQICRLERRWPARLFHLVRAYGLRPSLARDKLRTGRP
jgi:hypothetical protein